jgi:hypothetical protein
LIEGGPIVQEHEQLDLRCSQVDVGRLLVGLVLHALQLQPVEIDLGDVACGEPVAADGEDLIEEPQVVSGQRQDRFRLQSLHESIPQVEKKRPFQVCLTRHGNGRRLLRAFQPQLALVPALEQVGG